jgi:glyoxylase-like metal-dependent hydrolase (beta-lactamase superfamily II)
MREPSNYDFEFLTEDIVAAVARRGGIALSNSGLGAVQDEVLVFDTSLTFAAANDLIDAGRHRWGKAPALVVNSHWHLDHVLGNQRFPGIPIWASSRTKEILEQRAGELLGDLSAEKLEERIREVEGYRAAATSVLVKDYLDGVLRISRALRAQSADIVLTPPTHTFQRRKSLDRARGVELLCFGPGHTQGDAVLFYREGRVLFAGDLVVVGQHPNVTSGDPKHWIHVLDAIDRLNAERVVPGHGPVATAEATGPVRDYLTTLLRFAESTSKVEIPDRFRRWEEPGQFDANVSYVRANLGRGPRSVRD